MRSPPTCRGCGDPLPVPPDGRMVRSRYHGRCRPTRTRAPLHRRRPLARRRPVRVGAGPATGPRHPQYRGGTIRRRGVPAALATAIRAAWAHRCAYCGRPEAENGAAPSGRPRRLTIEHVRPYRLFLAELRDAAAAATAANAPGNLVPSCARCNAVKSSGAERRARRGDVLDQRRYERLAAAGRPTDG